MYPPSDEPDSARIARNEAEFRWIWRWVFPVLYSVPPLIHSYVKHRWWSLAAWIFFLATCFADAILQKNGTSARLRWGLRIGLLAVFVGLGLATLRQ
jgi:hypothetical protein